MQAYASNTGTRRNLSALKDADWRIRVTPDKPKPPDGFRYGVDNGAWSCAQKGLPFAAGKFERLVERYGAGADWVVLPDIVAGGQDSLRLSLEWLPRLRHLRLLLLPVQDGMEKGDIGRVLEEWPQVGIFVGGSTEFKLTRLMEWSCLAHGFRRWLHVGRVNTGKRIQLCHKAGATSFDGSSVSRFAENIERLESWRIWPGRPLRIPKRGKGVWDF